MNKPLVSIITPSLNQGRYIEETILSVLNQTYENLEYLIMDGGSTDSTHEIVRKYENDPRLKLYSQNDEGQYDAVNKGFLIAHGDILGWINTDDIYGENAVEKAVRVFENNTDVDIIYGKFRLIDENSKILRQRTPKYYSLKWLRRYCFINPSVTFIKASLIHTEGFLIHNDIPNYGDWDWFLRMGEAGKRFYYLPEMLGYFRFHPGSKICVMTDRQIYEERLMISHRHKIPLQYISVWYDFLMPWLQRIECFSYLFREKGWRETINRSCIVAQKLAKGVLKRIK